MSQEEFKVGEIVKTTFSRDRGIPQKIIAVREGQVSFTKIWKQYIWVDIKNIKRIKK
jgi:hypothetical protein